MLRVTRPSIHEGQLGGDDSMRSRRKRRPSPDAARASTASEPRSWMVCGITSSAASVQVV